MNTPLVSIITPAYNAENYIAQTIESVQNQSFSNWELLIVNDCSSDGTLNIAERYAAKDTRIKTTTAAHSSGAAAARNLGLAQAKGQYIAFLDSDDCWVPDKLTKQIAFMQEKNAAFCFSSYQLMDSSGKPINRFIYSKPSMTYKDVLKNTLIGCLTVVVDREQVGDFRMPLIPHTEDTMTWAEILKRGFVAHGMPDVLALYRISTNSLTSNKLQMAKLQWGTYRKYCQYGILKSICYFFCYAVNALRKILGSRNNSRPPQ